jgi:putative phosphoesterase
MDTILVFGDIHGNLPALEAVFTDIEKNATTENRYCLGDLVGYGTFPNEVVQTIRERQIPTIMGNYDQGVSLSSDDCGCAYTTEAARKLGERSIAWTNAVVTQDNKAYLAGLAPEIRLMLGELRVLLVHGSPRKINEYLYEDRSDASFERIMDAANADVLVFGHTHLPYHKVLPSGRHLVNAGSVGKPKDNNPDACYVLLSNEKGHLNVQFLRVAYDVEKAAQAIESSEMPSEFAKMLREGRG